jgi:octaheme c-type cytochrome (tetrathionate reductase family)
MALASSRLALLAVVVGAVTVGGIGLGAALRSRPPDATTPRAAGFQRTPRAHFDHAPVIDGPFETPQAVTQACLSCHRDAGRQVIMTSHWRWLGPPAVVPGHGDQPQRIGKKNLINNFCISSEGNNRSCTKCHAGYGWADDTFNFEDTKNVDCLVCHDQTNTYVKGDFGLPAKGTNLVAVARSVGPPSREACLTCHAFGGGGQAVKHGDLDSSLNHPSPQDDVHMGRYGLACADCHGGSGHQIRGRAFSVSVEDSGGASCADCHTKPEHRDARINAHLSAVACQTCHIPTFARRIPTKASWDWSKAGDSTRQDDPHRYLKIKGEFVYEQDAIPEYRWFNLTVDRYLAGDKLDPAKVTDINRPRGDIRDAAARIWPFKVHQAKQPYDSVNQILLTPVTAGVGGYWSEFDWDKAFRLGSKATGLPYSGKYGFADTEMFWPLTHMVVPKERALGCTDCHGQGGRLDWKALGYPGDPIKVGGRR